MARDFCKLMDTASDAWLGRSAQPAPAGGHRKNSSGCSPLVDVYRGFLELHIPVGVTLFLFRAGFINVPT